MFPVSPYVSARFCATASDSLERSTAVTCAPARAKLMVSVPMPQPTSRTCLPRQRSNCAKAGMWGSTKYFRASTSSKYSLVPTGILECRMLQGLRSQYAFTVSMETADSAANLTNRSLLTTNSFPTTLAELQLDDFGNRLWSQ